ncbi:MAG: type III ribulose-bisphosphate carboxylase [Candidatus Aenigmatarchaeota archaeon]
MKLYKLSKVYNIMSYIDLKYKPKDDIVCEFYVEPAEGLSIREAAEHLAGESSVGTWTEVKTSSPRIKKIAARVFSISDGRRQKLPSVKRRGNYIRIAYPAELFEEGNMPQIMSSVAGNIFGMKAVENLRLLDLSFPQSIVKSFKGPLYGIEGVRKVTGVKDRPLIGTIVKPKLGLDEKSHSKVAYDAWVGGVDIVKDDENLSSQSFNRFGKRLELTVKMKEKAERETGEKKIYMPNVTAETREMLRRAKMVKDSGNEYLMVDVLTVGWSGLQTLREENEDLKLVIHAHRAMHAALTRNKKHGISMLALAKTYRLIGVDQLHIGTIVGKMEGSEQDVLNIRDAITFQKIKSNENILGQDWHGIKPVFPVCSGGLHAGHVPSLLKYFGNDVIIQAGGGIHGHPNGTISGARSIRQAVDAAMQKISLEEYAKTHRELADALKEWK